MKSSIFVLLFTVMSCVAVHKDVCLVGKLKYSNNSPIVLIRFERRLDEISATPVDPNIQNIWCGKLRDILSKEFNNIRFWCMNVER